MFLCRKMHRIAPAQPCLTPCVADEDFPLENSPRETFLECSKNAASGVRNEVLTIFSRIGKIIKEYMVMSRYPYFTEFWTRSPTGLPPRLSVHFGNSLEA
jgi:hypothetical protein